MLIFEENKKVAKSFFGKLKGAKIFFRQMFPKTPPRDTVNFDFNSISLKNSGASEEYS